MKINVRHLVILCLGLFLVKVVIADPFRLQKKERGPGQIRSVSIR
jgi:hypothetical protein